MMKLVIGVISDTHGLVRPEVVSTFRDCQLIIHAGDIGSPDVMERLKEMAPVVAVRGNMDKGEWAGKYPLTETVTAENKNFYILHELSKLDLVPQIAGFDAIISGHTHKPLVERREGVLFLNPGSAGPKRFNLPVCLALIEIDNNLINTRIVEI